MGERAIYRQHGDHRSLLAFFQNKESRLKMVLHINEELRKLSWYSDGLWAGWGLIPRRGKRFFSSPQCPDWLWGPPSLLYNGYQGLFP
jgi:hypothetical protein